MIKTIAAHLSTAITVLGVVGSVGIYAFNAYAGELIDEKVDEKLAPLTESVEEQASQIGRFATQQAVQAEQLRILQEGQREANRDIKLILRALRSN